MEDNRWISMLEQYIADGKDATALLADCRAMLANGKTPLGLNQWKHSDKPRMEDFNADNRIIDQEIGSLKYKVQAVEDIDERLSDAKSELEEIVLGVKDEVSELLENADTYSRGEVNEALENKVNGAWTTYHTLNELGITVGEETILQIAVAMKNNSELFLCVSGEYNNSGGYPVNINSVGGILHVVKTYQERQGEAGAYRVDVAFQTSNTYNQSGYNARWMQSGAWIDGGTPGLTGWKKLVTASTKNPLVLSSKFTEAYAGSCWYEVDEVNGLVTLNVHAKATSDIAYNDTILTMPVGLRGYKHQVVALLSPSGSPVLYATMSISSSGAVVLVSPNSPFPANCRQLSCRFTYDYV